MCNLLQPGEEIIILIETFGGKRVYYYYVAESLDFEKRLNEVKAQFKSVKLEVSSYRDEEWDFLNDYPIKFPS